VRLCLLVALLIAAPGPARAYVRAVTPGGTPWRWDRPVLTLKVHAGAPGTESSAELLQAVAGAAAPWSQPHLSCTSVDITVEGVADARGPVKRDGINRVVFRRDSWCPEPREPGEACYTPQTLAQTTDVVDLKTGEILESDIEVNAVDHVWSDSVQHPGAVPGAHDLQNTLTHELGHLLGFAHSCHLRPGEPSTVDDQGRPVPGCTEASPEAVASTMYPTVSETDLDRRTLTEDDERGACEVYPKGITSGQTGIAGGQMIVESGEGGCGIAKGRPATFIFVLVLALVLGTRATGARSPRRRPADPAA
jgi:hypothetical protein